MNLAPLVLCPSVRARSGEVGGYTELSEADIVSIDKAEVYGLVWFNGINLHVGGLGEWGRFVAHKPPVEGAELI